MQKHLDLIENRMQKLLESKKELDESTYFRKESEIKHLEGIYMANIDMYRVLTGQEPRNLWNNKQPQLTTNA